MIWKTCPECKGLRYNLWNRYEQVACRRCRKNYWSVRGEGRIVDHDAMRAGVAVFEILRILGNCS